MNNFTDDERTVANMNVEGFSWYKGKNPKNHEEIINLDLGPKERKALRKGAMAVYMPIIFIYGISFFVIFLLLDLLWIN